MAYKTKLFNSLHLTRDAQERATGHDGALAELMANPDYLRHSSQVINDALKDGFDVLQLPNGDIVTTGTKVITNTYVWDMKSGKLMKARAAADKSSDKASKRKAKSSIAEESEGEEADVAAE